ncbi:MAG TPA: YccF domain-containing protein [Acholeplasmataceae bacterium]|nr:YccF domain-containing protein [Acholeplasmataceae bacterium]
MKVLGNIIWLLFGGLIAAALWFIFGILLMLTIIGLPFGLQLIKFSRLMLWPFGYDVTINFDKHPIMNILWLLIVGLGGTFLYLVIGVVFCITIVGIPFGLQWFKLTKLSLLPFGAKIRAV